MKNSWFFAGLILVGLCCVHLNGHAQTYVYTKIEGQEYEFRADPSTLPGYREGAHPGRYAESFLGHPNNDVLSQWQELPFTWSFYGQPVTGYYASDNGYITFDRGASEGIPHNTSIPNPAEPNDAIYVFWDDWKLAEHHPRTNLVMNMTMGRAPNRMHLIMWNGVMPGQAPDSEGASNTCSFFLALHENGDFDIVLMAGRKTVPMAATIGVENHDGTLATMVDGSPDIDFPPLTPAPDDLVIYEFRYSDLPYGASVTGTDLPDIVRVGQEIEISGLLQNQGVETMQSFDLYYQVDDHSPVAASVHGVSVASSESIEFRHTVPWLPAEAGKMYQLKLWIDNINGRPIAGDQQLPAYTREVFAHLGQSARKRVLVEQFTGTWCVWCPDGSVQVSEIERQYPNAVLVAIHAGGNDAMIVPEGQAIADAYRPSYPMAMVDRFRFEGQGFVPMARTRNAWLHAAAERLEHHTPVELSIRHDFDPATRAIEATVHVDFVDYAYPGDMRLHFMVVEDRVTGEGRGYDQANAFSNNQSFPDHLYFTEPNPIPGYVHRHVLRALPWGVEGKADAIPVNPAPGQAFTQTLAYVLPDEYNHREISLVAFMAYHDQDELSGNHVLNVVEVPLQP